MKNRPSYLDRKVLTKKEVIVDSSFVDNLLDSTDRSTNKAEIILEAKRCWDALYDVRKTNERNLRYTFGNQWSDIVPDPDNKGRWITEEWSIKKQGNVPLKNNVIIGVVNAILGQYRGNETDVVCTARDREEQELGEMMTVALQCNHQMNRINELDARTLQEFIISAMAIQKESWGFMNNKMDVWTSTVLTEMFFVDPNMKDVRHWDADIVGQIHDFSFEKLISTFSKKRDDAVRLKNIYNFCNSSKYIGTMEAFTNKRLDNVDFLTPKEPGLCRVIEVWKRETVERLQCHDTMTGEYYIDEANNQKTIEEVNNQRILEGKQYGVAPEDIALIEYEWILDRPWVYYFLSPFGDIIDTGESAFAHKSHPFTFKLYPFIHSEIHSPVEGLIDQQRYINRMVILNDFMLRNSAKGVLMYPEALIPDGMTKEQVAAEWVRHDGVIFYTPKPGVDMPKQMATNVTNIGTYEMISLQMKFVQEVSGVYGAMQGKEAPSGTAASMYRQQSLNSSNNLSDLLTSFKSFLYDRDMKKVKMIQQFYTENRYFNIGGNSNGMKFYDASKVSDIEYDIAISDSVQTPVYRMAMNEILIDLFKAQAINVEQLLETGTFPFADKLLQSIRSMKENMQQGLDPGSIPPEVMNQINAQANPKALQMMNINKAA